MTRLFLCFLLTQLSITYSYTQRLSIAVSANAQYALTEIVDQFKRSNNIEIDIIVGSSGKLTTQILQGAPYHIFFSADMDYPNELFKKGFTVEAPKIYAYGAVVMWTMKNLDLGHFVSTLKSDRVTKICLPNPKLAPYGEEAIRILKYYKLDKELEGKIILGENVAQVNHYIFSKACDIGFTSKSSVMSPTLAAKGKWVEVNPSAYEPIKQGVVVLKRGKEEATEFCEQFIDFIFSKEGRRILEKNGYMIK